MDVLHIAEELQSLADTGTRVPGFRKKMVDVDRLIGLAEEIRRSIPANIQEAEEVLRQKDSILNQTYLEAKRIKTSAEQEAAALAAAAQREHHARVDESEILKTAEAKGQEINDEAMMEAHQVVQDAQKRANRIVDESENVAHSRKEGADQYAAEVLYNLEERLAEQLGQVRRGIDALGLEVEGQQAGNHAAA